MDSPRKSSLRALPVDDVLPMLRESLARRNAAVLVAPPGAGKTTRVPPALLSEPWTAAGKILVLEPRRLAARAAAQFMAAAIGEPLGQTIGLRIRYGSKTSAKTRIEFVTEGVFARLVLDDPELKNVAAVVFDEFHERSLDADFGLALALDVQRAFREDLRILVMSATLDGARVAALLGDASVIESEGRAFPVETLYLGRAQNERIEDAVTAAAIRALDNETGSVLAFLPGAAEIRRTATRLEERIRDATVDIVPLYGALDSDVQDRAIAPAAPGRRKIVLATAIAQTSITIEGVRVVIDSGLARVPAYEPGLGLTRLETVRVSRAAADQRRGRAGRNEPGICYRLWDEPQNRSLLPFDTPEILSADLAGLALDLAVWGLSEPDHLAWLDPPPRAAWQEARTLLRELGALDGDGSLTATGRQLAKFPVHPRLAAMIVAAAEHDRALLAAEIAAVIGERGLGGTDTDLAHRIERFRRESGRRADEARKQARNWAAMAGGSQNETTVAEAGRFLARAYPDRIAAAREQRSGAFLLANGRGARVELSDPLAREPLLAVAELSGAAQEARILLAARLDRAVFDSDFADRIETRETAIFDPKSKAARAVRGRTFGALVLDAAPGRGDAGELARVLAGGVATLGLEAIPFHGAASRLAGRGEFLRRSEGGAWPDLSREWLATNIESWLAPFLAGKRSVAEISAGDIEAALRNILPGDLARRLDREAPELFVAPTGSRLAIDYGAEAGPTVAARVQEFFGLREHPAVAGGRIPLVLSLLSPAGRPIQVTRDLPAFWSGSWADVKKEMRGRYPRHVWPDDPANAAPTRRAKARGT